MIDYAENLEIETIGNNASFIRITRLRGHNWPRDCSMTKGVSHETR
jgi:hypothetical protein